ncbi:unnamed protein product, partial [Ectocarpus fasciculatus]
ANSEDTAFSRTLESVRKDVECFFGVLKGSFRILKLRLGYRSKEDIDTSSPPAASCTTCFTSSTAWTSSRKMSIGWEALACTTPGTMTH